MKHAAQTDLDLESSTAVALCVCVDVCWSMHVSTEKPAKASEVLLKTSCADCLVISSNYTIGGSTFGGLQLLSKT